VRQAPWSIPVRIDAADAVIAQHIISVAFESRGSEPIKHLCDLP